MITKLEPNQIFVFGSNLAGNHAGGGALYAKEHFGAIEGRGMGLQGQSYAFPTLNSDLKQLDFRTMNVYRDEFYRVAKENPDKEFLLTAVGTGIARYSTEWMKHLFQNPPKNVILPEEFK